MSGLTFGMLAVGDKFKFDYNCGLGPVRLSEDVLVKISPRKYRNTKTGAEWQTGSKVAIVIQA